MAIDPEDLVIGCRFKFHNGDSENTVVKVYFDGSVDFEYFGELCGKKICISKSQITSSKAFITYTPKTVEVENDTSEAMAKKLVEGLEKSGFFDMIVDKMAQRIMRYPVNQPVTKGE